MQLPLDVKALGGALVAVFLALGSAGLLARSIKMMPGPGPTSTTASSTGTFDEIVTLPQLANQGHEFFEMSCSQCHGDDAHGDEGPDLHNLSISNARIATTIKKGIKGEMPTFAKKYDDRQVAALVSYLRTLR
jgi:mono/diheme cytochrome c family protein